MADYACQEPGWVYVPPPCKSPEDHDRYACGCSYVARLAMQHLDGDD
jgi:hypothetical protein